MKKKIKMICILKSGAIVEDTIKVDRKNTRAYQVVNEMRKGIENSLGYEKPAVQNITFGKTTVSVSEIAAITFKD
jgi:hypothetical protein